MKVRDLIEQLRLMDPELEVWKSKDDEGNEFSLIWNICDDAYRPEHEMHSTDFLPTKEDLEDDADYVQVLVIT